MNFGKIIDWHASKKWHGYAVAVLSSLLALFLRHIVVHEELHRAIPYLFFYFSLTASAWYGGLGPGVAATFLGFKAATGYILKVQNLEYDITARLHASVFVVTGIFISILFETLHRARKRIAHKGQLLEEEVQERRRAQAALVEADKHKNAFLATLAHELRNPLSAVSNALELLDHADDERVVRKAREIMSRQMGHALRIVDDLMDTARISENKLAINKSPVPLSSVLQTAIEGVRPLIDRREHVLSVSIAPQPLWINGDAARLTQVFMNILANAAKYTEPKGSISLTAKQEGKDVKITVRDNGIGIPEQLLPSIFDMYMQADSALAHSQGGLGIGLSLVRRLVSLHGGAVKARSAGIGKGSEFEVTLPVISRDETQTNTWNGPRPGSGAATIDPAPHPDDRTNGANRSGAGMTH